MYLDNRNLNFDKIYARIVEIHINLGNLDKAHEFSDKIENKSLKIELNKRIENLQFEKSRTEAKEAEDFSRGEISKERLSIIRNKARAALKERESLLKQNKSLRRAYFSKALIYLNKKDYDNAIISYEENVNRLIDIGRLELAGVSLALLLLLHINQERIEDFRKILNQIKNKLGSLKKSFSETFSVSLVEYILNIEKLDDYTKLLEALEFMDNLPLVDEEVSLLYDISGKSLKTLEPEDLEKKIAEIEISKEKIHELVLNIPKEKNEIAKRKWMKSRYWKLALEDLINQKYEVAANDYKETIPRLLEEKYYRQAALSLILNSFILIKIKGVSIAKSNLNDVLAKYKKLKSDFEDLPEIEILKQFLFALEDDILELVDLCIHSLIEKLVLFDPEISLLESLMPEEPKSEPIEEKLSREEVGERTKFNIKIEQKYGKLLQKMGDVRRERAEFLKQRVAMKKRYYKKVITLLEIMSFKEIGLEYFNLAETMSKRRDFRTSSLMVLIHGIALIKSKESTQKIRSNISRFLESLGFNKKLVEDTYYIRCIDFILDVISNKMDKYLSKINGLLEILPLFEEEKQLIEVKL